MYVRCGATELDYLRAKDARLGAVIDSVGTIRRPVGGPVFESLIHHIIGQQISLSAQSTVWERLQRKAGAVTPQSMSELSVEQIQSFGMTYRKAEYISEFVAKVVAGDFDTDSLADLSDTAVIAELTKLRGVGVWTAEMMLIFSLQRPDILSFGDLAIQRGLRMIYRHRQIDRRKFERYRRRYSPYATTASLYIWEVASGRVAGMVDLAAGKAG